MAETVTKILESGTTVELEQMSAFHKLSPEKIKFLSHYAKLRRNTIDDKNSEVAKRKEDRKEVTQEEIDMGCYIENIEPQVRSAVLNLHRKGYTTFESGFHGHKQKIGFKNEPLLNFQFPEKLAQQLKENGVSITVKPGSISFQSERELELDEIEKIWNQIESALPDLEQPAQQNPIRHAQSFRKKQQKSSS